MPEITPSRYLINAGWDDVPHISEKAKKELLGSILPYQHDARTKGLPSLGAGAIYPVPQSDFTVDPFKIPAYWPCFYGMDVGWKKTAVIWCAWDRQEDVVYLHAEHYVGHAEPSSHVTAIKARGAWKHGVIDPASRGRSQHDGAQLMQDYIELGLKLHAADNLVDSGLLAVYLRLTTGRLKVFRTCANWLQEFSLYHRDEKGHIVKEFDHLMDATRYAIGPETIREGRTSGLQVASLKPVTGPKMATGSAHGGDRMAGY